MKIGVDVEGLDAVCQMLTDYGDAITPAAAKGLARGLALVERDAKKLCTAVDTGELRNSIRTQIMRSGSKTVIGDVFSPKEYAVYIEMGTGDRGRASGGNGSKAVKSYLNGWAGMAARPFLYPAFKANKKKVVEAIRKAIREEAR